MADEEFFCIYSGKMWPVAERSKEHIIPYSIGGTDKLVTYDVARLPNNQMGHTADAGLVDSFFLSYERHQHKIASASGRIPDIEFKGHAVVDDRPVPVTFRISPDGSSERRHAPQIKANWEESVIHIRCDPTDLPRIAKDLAKKAQRRGVAVDAQDIIDNTPVKDAIQSMVAWNIDTGIGSLALGFVKMALGIGHLVFGHEWSRSRHADRFREALQAGASVDLQSLGIVASIWPHPNHGTEGIRSTFEAGPTRHTILLLNTTPVSCAILLFGYYFGIMQLAPSPLGSAGVAPKDGRIIVIDAVSRERWDFSLARYLWAKAQGHPPVFA